MKLATIPVEDPRNESERRDERLVVVDDQRGLLLPVPHVAPNLWAAIREWDRMEPELQAASGRLREDRLEPGETTLPLAGQRFMAPLPRTTCWIDGSAYIQHIILVRKARNADPPETLETVPLMYQGCADPLLGPNDDVLAASEDHGIDLEAEVGVILDEVPMGTRAEDAARHIKLLCIMNDVSLRNLIPAELKAGFGFFHGKPPTSFAPFVVTPDEVGGAWKDGRLHLPMRSWINGKRFGDPDAGPEMHFSFPQLIEHAAKTRPLPAGTILGSGTVSNKDTARGCSCLAERRMLETIQDGAPSTPFLSFGDRVRIEVTQDGRSVFGAIDQKVAKYDGPGGR